MQTRFREYRARPPRVGRRVPKPTLLSPSPLVHPTPGPPSPVEPPEAWVRDCTTPTDLEPCTGVQTLGVVPDGNGCNADVRDSAAKPDAQASPAHFAAVPQSAVPRAAGGSATLPRMRAHTSGVMPVPQPVLDRRHSLSFDAGELSPARTFQTEDKVPVRRNTGRKLPPSTERVQSEASLLRRVTTPPCTAAVHTSSCSCFFRASPTSPQSPQSAPTSPFRARQNGSTPLPTTVLATAPGNVSSDA